ncbi:MAG: signal peptidase II [Prevotellaceae bacterium]|jgi:signal peptidase II|nr:signal peptidase II [Prevotellaceae bacterium]
MKKSIKIALFIALLLIIDQTIKILVKTNMPFGKEIPFLGLGWFQLVFVENNGMAFGMEFGSKTILTLFRLIISGLMLYYIIRLIKNNYGTAYILCVSLIFAGAIGNIIDCVFYGLIFGESSFLNGRVVDMFQFQVTYPSWLPYLSGKQIFDPVFNFADSCITIGIFVLILFFRKDFNQTFDEIFSKKKAEK